MGLVTVNYEGFSIDYHLNDRLKKNLDEKIIPNLTKKDKDQVIVIDGGEGSGKSTLASQVGKYVDPSLNLDRICFTADEFKEAIFRAKKGQCVIYDEAFTGLSSRAALSRINRMLISLMMQMRQKNLFVIIVLPTIFMLERYVAIFRTLFLIHVYENKGRRGYFLVFNKQKKKKLYLDGKKTFSYSTTTRFKGRFYGKFALGDEVDIEYRKKKAEALEKVEESGEVGKMEAKNLKRLQTILYIVNKTGWTIDRITEELLLEGCPISRSQVGNMIKSYKENKA